MVVCLPCVCVVNAWTCRPEHSGLSVDKIIHISANNFFTFSRFCLEQLPPPLIKSDQIRSLWSTEFIYAARLGVGKLLLNVSPILQMPTHLITMRRWTPVTRHLHEVFVCLHTELGWADVMSVSEAVFTKLFRRKFILLRFALPCPRTTT